MKITGIDASVFVVPTAGPEADGTAAWDRTTVVLVEAHAEGGLAGLGYTYGAAAAARVVRDLLLDAVRGRPVDDVGAAWQAMLGAVRNAGLPGVVACAISAVDAALWDLKARAHGVPVFRLLGAHRDAVLIYGSGGFTTYPEAMLAEQLRDWVERGIPRVKMKIGRDEAADLRRVAAARAAIGPEAELFVDANGAYGVKQAIRLAERFSGESGVTYFEEPVSSDHLDELAEVRAAVEPAVAAGEYGYTPWYFREMLQAGAVDILQADVTRCLGLTGWLQAAALAFAFGVPFSAHCAPSLHAQVGCAAPQLSHVEWFHDHACVEAMLFDGVPSPAGGELRPDPERPGLGLELKRTEAERWRVAA
jgi:L-alanine-DL-glutamate epimerase-like enolase superfamily enzyme